MKKYSWQNVYIPYVLKICLKSALGGTQAQSNKLYKNNHFVYENVHETYRAIIVKAIYKYTHSHIVYVSVAVSKHPRTTRSYISQRSVRRVVRRIHTHTKTCVGPQVVSWRERHGSRITGELIYRTFSVGVARVRTDGDADAAPYRRHNSPIFVCIYTLDSYICVYARYAPITSRARGKLRAALLIT